MNRRALDAARAAANTVIDVRSMGDGPGFDDGYVSGPIDDDPDLRVIALRETIASFNPPMDLAPAPVRARSAPDENERTALMVARAQAFYAFLRGEGA